MNENELKRASADALARLGREASRTGDRATLRACVHELEYRSSRAAAAVEAELRQLLRAGVGSEGRADHGPDEDAPQEARIEVLTDGEIKHRRLRMIEYAEHSLWLSSLTFPDAELANALIERARAGVDVTLIVADKKARKASEEVTAEVRRSKVKLVRPPSTHSKVLVVDEALVMVGSANAHGGHRDLCVEFRSEPKAKEIVTYLRTLRG